MLGCLFQIMSSFFSGFPCLLAVNCLSVALLGPCCVSQAFSSGAGTTLRLSVRASRRRGSLCAEHRLQAPGLWAAAWWAQCVCRARALSAQAGVAVVQGLSCSSACGIFLARAQIHVPCAWQVDSQQLDHQGCPGI